MDLLNTIIGFSVFQRLTNLGTGHIELTGIILVEITGQGAEWLFCGEGEGGSCGRHNHAEPME